MAFVLVGAALLAAGVVGSKLRAAQAPTAAVKVQLANHEEIANGSFGVSGVKDGLYPGATLDMPLTITNPNSFPIEIKDVTTTVSTDAAGCATSNISFGAVPKGVIVPANASTVTAIPVTLAAAAPDRCQAVTFTLSFTGGADPAPGVNVPRQQHSEVAGAVLERPQPQAQQPQPTNRLARTGLPLAATLAAGLAFAVVGLVLLLVGRRPALAAADHRQ